MQNSISTANAVTSKAMLIVLKSLKEGSNSSDFINAFIMAHNKLAGERAEGLANFGQASAFPHGSTKPQTLKKWRYSVSSLCL